MIASPTRQTQARHLFMYIPGRAVLSMSRAVCKSSQAFSVESQQVSFRQDRTIISL